KGDAARERIGGEVEPRASRARSSSGLIRLAQRAVTCVVTHFRAHGLDWGLLMRTGLSPPLKRRLRAEGLRHGVQDLAVIGQGQLIQPLPQDIHGYILRNIRENRLRDQGSQAAVRPRPARGSACPSAMVGFWLSVMSCVMSWMSAIRSGSGNDAP